MCTFVLFSIKRVHSSPVGAPFYPLNPEDLTEGDIKEIEFWDNYYHRPKRSGAPSGSGAGSADLVYQLKSAVVSGLKQKIGQVAKGSAGAVVGASAGFSKGSSAGSSHGEAKDHHTIVYGAPPPPVEKPFSFWELKKSVLNTLLQAVKAIQGGVLAIKGQLIKGSGFVVSGGGKLISAGGDKVTQLGKNIISNAVLVPATKGHPLLPSSLSLGHPAHYTSPDEPTIIYDSPPPSAGSSGAAYIPESHYEGSYDFSDVKLSDGPHAGLVILRRVTPSKEQSRSVLSQKQDPTPSDHKTVSSSVSSGGSKIVGNVLKASNYLNENPATSLGNTAQAVVYDSHGNQYTPEKYQFSLNSPNGNKYESLLPVPSAPVAPAAPPHATAPAAVPPPPSGEKNSHNIDLSFSTSAVHSVSNNVPFGGDFPGQHGFSSDYAPAFESDNGFSNFNDHLTSASNTREHKVRLTKGELLDNVHPPATVASSQIKLPEGAPSSLDVLKQVIKTEKAVGTTADNSGYFSKNPSYFQNVKLNDNSLVYTPSKETFYDDHSPSLSSLANFLPKDTSKVPNTKDTLEGFSNHENFFKSYAPLKVPRAPISSSSRYKVSTSKLSSVKKRKRTPSDYRQRRPSTKGDYQMIKSISYEITPEGPKRLT